MLTIQAQMKMHGYLWDAGTKRFYLPYGKDSMTYAEAVEWLHNLKS